ncbi:hypothetical protein N7456_013712 [Penicillium angulare]|uniref:25S rRNA (uridine-N(3))-methyltransferase BMT5-like domain-containing protein n=1 Tax=Penicillium angulare TaxID=116970 RepID=A0A9W9JTQ9_9EURO|nr:hypothetical protein N7456_013712 [Penicillium angulare]
MPRKKQKGPPPRAQRAGGPPKPGQTPVASQSKSKGKGAGNAPHSKAGGDEEKKMNKAQAPLQANQRPIVPFLRGDRILLVGEGDFSFARSLAKQYKCRKLCATCYDSEETLLGKYPQAEQNIQDVLQSSKRTKSQDENPTPDEKEQHQQQNQSTAPKVLYSIDARKLGVSGGGGGKEIKIGFPRKERKIPAWKIQQQKAQGQDVDSDDNKPLHNGPWDVICFNFPHVGGLSTDVNRQVRSNQELLVSFFKACVPLLSAAPVPVDEDDEWDDEDEEEEEDGDDDSEDEEDQSSGKEVRTGPGQILVSLFEAEPYTLWNIKDLARHAGLQVVTSFRFPWTSYEGYSHARTLGEVEGKNGGRGGWRGEDREARMYVFEVPPPPKRSGKKRPKHAQPHAHARKRTRDDDSSDSE